MWRQDVFVRISTLPSSEASSQVQSTAGFYSDVPTVPFQKPINYSTSDSSSSSPPQSGWIAAANRPLEVTQSNFKYSTRTTSGTTTTGQFFLLLEQLGTFSSILFIGYGPSTFLLQHQSFFTLFFFFPLFTWNKKSVLQPVQCVIFLVNFSEINFSINFFHI